MEEKEMLEQTNESENTDTQAVEEIVDGETNTTDSDEEVLEEEKEVKTFTQEEVDEILRKRLARKDREHQKELSKYKNLENVLNAGLGTHTIEEAESNLREYYTSEGVKMPDPIKPGLDERELKVLGNNDADEILELGLDEAEKEANRLAKIGRSNWNAREEAEFFKLASKLDYEKKKNELKSIGVNVDILESKDFKDFAEQFNHNTDIKNIVNLYSQTHKDPEPKKFEKMGSMKTTPANEVKEFYTYEEASKFTRKDFEANPELFKAVENSMTKW